MQKTIAGYLSRAMEAVAGEELYVKRPLLPLDEIPPRFEKLMSRLAEEKIVKKYSAPRPIPGWPRVSSFLLELSTGILASGYARDIEAAATKAFAETLERHAYTAFGNKEFIVGSWNELASQNAVDPKRFASFSPTQLGRPEYASYKFDEGSKFQWTKALSLLDKKEHLVPAQLVYLRYSYLSGEPIIRGQTSSGGAAGNSPEMAAHNAVCELIERDALMIHWLNKISPPRLDLNFYHNSDIDFLISQYKKYDIDFAVLDITTDLDIPVALTAVRGKTLGRPVIFVSPRADLDIETAIIATLTDGLRAGYWSEVSEEQRQKARDKYPRLENIEERRWHWTDLNMGSEADFLFAGKQMRIRENKFAGADIKTKLGHIKRLLKEWGLECFLADITTPIAREFGVTVLRALIPEIYPLYLNETQKYLGIRRLFETPVKMGVFGSPKKEEEMNQIPHPML